MVEQGCSGSWTESVGPRSECRTQREPQELFDLFFGNQMFYDIHRDLKNLSSFFFYIKISLLLDWLPGWLATKEMEFIKRQGTNVCQCIATYVNNFCNKRSLSLFTSSDFQFSLPQCCCCPQIEHVRQDMKGSMLPHPESLALNIFSQNLSLVIKHHGFNLENFIIENSLETDLRKHSLVLERVGHMHTCICLVLTRFYVNL